MKYLLIIELLSDACICSGSSYGASIDTDVYTDEYGFPYIPSKRLKGLFRDAFNEYNEYISDEINIDKLLGYNDSIAGELKISNAFLKDFILEKDKIIADIKKNKIMPATIKSMYVSNRTQTSIEDGVAKEKSLRSTNVVNKGLKFISEVEMPKNDAVKEAVKLIKHMGLHRNRGLGLVNVELVEDKNNTLNSNIKHFEIKDNQYIELKITNLQPLMISSNVKDETLPYISGSTIYGFFANEYAKNNNLKPNEENADFSRLFLESNLKFSNAYISDEEFNEYVPVPDFIKKQKNKGQDGTTVYLNMLVENEKKKAKKTNNNSSLEQEDAVKTASLTNKFIRLSDLTNEKGIPLRNLHVIEPIYEYNYHINMENGEVNKNDKNGFYSYYALAANQHFIAKIYGKAEYLRSLIKAINDRTMYLGKCKNSQYSKCVFDIAIKNKPIYHGNIFVPASPIILENGKIDINSLTANLHTEALDYSLNYASFGGYNFMWKLPKPQKTAINFGSYLIAKDSLEYKEFIGLDNHAGFGEYILLSKENVLKSNEAAKNTQAKSAIDSFSYSSELFKTGKYNNLKKQISGMNLAYNTFNIVKNEMDLNSTQIEKMFKILMVSESYSIFEQNIEEVGKTRKNYKNNFKLFVNDAVNDSNYKIYFETLLTLFKYYLRTQDGGRKHE